MNNIFNTYNNNLYSETIKKDINLQVVLNIPVINNIITNYYDKSFNIKQQGLTKFIKTLVNIYFSHITKDDLRPLLLLGFKQIHPTLLTLNESRLKDALISHHGNKHPSIILSEIVSSLSYNNRDAYAGKFRSDVQKLFMVEKFEDELEPVYEINDQYYLLDLGEDNKTLHSSVKRLNVGTHTDIKAIDNNEQQFNYISNTSAVRALIITIDTKLKNHSVPNTNYLLLVKKFVLELQKSENAELLKQRKIDFQKFTKYIHDNQYERQITQLTIIELLKKLFFDEDIKSITVNTNLDTLDQDKLYNYKIGLLRSLTADELRELMDVNGLLLALIEKDNKLFLSLLEAIDLSSDNNINFKEYSSLEFKDKQKLINRLNNIQINNIIYKLDRTTIEGLIDNNKLKAKIIARNN